MRLPRRSRKSRRWTRWTYPDLDEEVNYGGQPVYYYVISVSKQTMNLDSQIRELKGVGEKQKTLFQNLGVYTVRDILLLFPREYHKFEEPKKCRWDIRRKL